MSQILAERIIHSMLDLTTIVNCFKGIGDDLEIGIYRGLKLKDQILKIVERVVEELKWINELKQAEMNEMQFGFTEGCGTQGVILILKMLSHVTLNLCLVENSKNVHARCLLFAQKCKMCEATYWSEILMCILFHDNFTLSKMAKNLENGVNWRFNLLLLFSLTSILISRLIARISCIKFYTCLCYLFIVKNTFENWENTKVGFWNKKIKRFK